MLSATERSADAAPPAQNGLATLTLERRAGRTRLTRVRTRPPLLVQQALYPDEAVPDMAYVFLANPTGGLLEGDRQEISVSVGSGARAHVTTQSATKVHTMAEGRAEQRVELNVAPGGYLEYLPDPLIPFKNACLMQRVDITLEPGATLVYCDVITPGRVARGEVFQYRKISNRLVVHRQQGHPTFLESFDLSPVNDHPMSMAVLGVPDLVGPDAPGGRTFGSMLALCDAESARRVIASLREALPVCDGVNAGVTILPDGNGVGVRIIGSDRSAAQSAAARVWSMARQQLLGVSPPFLRKY